MLHCLKPPVVATGGLRSQVLTGTVCCVDAMNLKLFLKIVFLILVLGGVWLYSVREPKLKPDSKPQRFVKFRGRYWIPLTINKTTRLVLFDTGSSYPFVDTDWVGSEYTNAASELVRSAFGTRAASGMIPRHMEFLGKNVSGEKVYADNGHASMVGGSLIFASSPFILAREGVEYPAQEIPRSDEDCFDIVPVHFTPQQGNGIRSVYLSISVDGKQELAFLDTGIAEELIKVSEAGGLFPYPEINTQSGQIALNFYRFEKSNVGIGKTNVAVKHKAYVGALGYREKYIIGAGILDRFSFYFDVNNSYGCMIKHKDKRMDE